VELDLGPTPIATEVALRTDSGPVSAPSSSAPSLPGSPVRRFPVGLPVLPSADDSDLDDPPHIALPTAIDFVLPPGPPDCLGYDDVRLPRNLAASPPAVSPLRGDLTSQMLCPCAATSPFPTASSIPSPLDRQELFRAILAEDDGFCYLNAIPDPYHQRFANRLGRFPTSEALREALADSRDYHLGVTVRACRTHGVLHVAPGVDSLLPILNQYPGFLVGADMLTRMEGTDHYEHILGRQLTALNVNIDLAENICPYYLTKAEKQFLTRLNIPISEMPSRRVVHPALKALENMILMTLAHLVLPGTIVSGMKTAKFNRLVRAAPAAGLILINPVLTAKDAVRYPTSNARTLPVGMRDYLTHDNGHFYTPGALLSFHVPVETSSLTFTAIIPIETIETLGSGNPSIYDLRYENDNVLFLPFGNATEGYVQPLSASWLLKTNTVVGPDFTISIELIASYGPHHIFRTSRMAGPPEAYRAYDLGDVVRLPDPTSGAPLSSPWCPRDIFDSCIEYVKSVEKFKRADIPAKVRSFSKDPRYAQMPLETRAHLVSLLRAYYLLEIMPTYDDLFLGPLMRLYRVALQALYDSLPPFLAEVFGDSIIRAERLRALILQPRYILVLRMLTIEAEVEDSLLFHNDLPPIEAIVEDVEGDGGNPVPLPPVPVVEPVAPQIGVQNPNILPLVHDHPDAPHVVLNVPQRDAHLTNLIFPAFGRVLPVPQVNTCALDIFLDAGVPIAELVAAWDVASPLFCVADANRSINEGGLSLLGVHILALVLRCGISVTYAGAPPPNAVRDVGLRRAQPDRSFTILFSTNPDHFAFQHPIRAGRGAAAQNYQALAGILAIAGGSSPRRSKGLRTWDLVTAGYTPFQRTAHRASARILHDEICTGLTFNLRHEDWFKKKIDAMKNTLQFSEVRSIPCVYFAGVAGCGKSTRVRLAAMTLGVLDSSLMIVSPLKRLRDQWETKLGLTKENQFVAQTLERAIKRRTEVLVLDEAQKYPEGYDSLFILCVPTLKHIIYLGDPRQAGASVLNTQSTIDPRRSVGVFLAPQITAYYEDSFRINPVVAYRLIIPTSQMNNGSGIHLTTTINKAWPLIVPTIKEQELYRASRHDTFTYSSCGGMDFDTPVTILISGFVGDSTGEDAIYTAFTRTSHDIHVIMPINAAEIQRVMNLKPILATLLGGAAPRSIEHFVPVTIDPAAYEDWRVTPTFPVGGALRSLGDRFDTPVSKFDGLGPFMKSSVLVSLPVPLVPRAVPPDEPEDMHVPCAAAAPRSHDLFLEARDLSDPESSEYIDEQGEWSHMNHSETLDLSSHAHLFPHHSAKYRSMFQPSVEKRLIFERTPGENLEEFRKKSFLGPLLADGFAKRHDLPGLVDFDPILFEAAVEDSNRKRLERPIPKLANLERDNDTALDLKTAQLFPKSQFVTKAAALPYLAEDELFSEAMVKPFQTIVSFTEMVASIMGPWTRYLDWALARFTPDTTLHYGGKTPGQFRRWVRRHMPESMDTLANDYTRYDQSCRGETLAFEILMMRRFSVPEEIIDLHFYLVTCVELSLGTLGIMRNSGQWCTLLFNTWYNEAVCCLRYELKQLPACFCGDDMLVLGVPSDNPIWERIRRHFALQFKTVISRKGEFCSWVLHPVGIFRDPLPMLAKLLFREARGTILDCVLSYLLEFEITYSYGDLLSDVLDDVSYEAYYQILLILRRYRRHLPKLFQSSPVFTGGHFVERRFIDIGALSSLERRRILSIRSIFTSDLVIRA